MATLDLTGTDYLQRRPTSEGVHTFEDRFTARYDYLYQGLAVVCQETAPTVWAVTAHPGIATTQSGGDGALTTNDINAADYVFYGSFAYEITDANLLAALQAAGYILDGVGFNEGFSGGFG